jgi:hypothetical protein
VVKPGRGDGTTVSASAAPWPEARASADRRCVGGAGDPDPLVRFGHPPLGRRDVRPALQELQRRSSPSAKTDSRWERKIGQRAVALYLRLGASSHSRKLSRSDSDRFQHSIARSS